VIGCFFDVGIVRNERPHAGPHFAPVAAEKNIAAGFAIEKLKNPGSAIACRGRPVK
jgi:hypothetical protein